MLRTLLGLLFLGLSLSCYASEHFSRMIVFGDSYSDNGNVFALSHGQYPNAVRYFKGRFSDGPVWSEYFARDFHLDPTNPRQFIDFAYGQAQVLAPTSINVTPNQTYAIPDLAQEIAAYVKVHKKINPDDLVVVFMATNDFFNVPKLHDAAFFQSIAKQEARDIQDLIQLGAQHIVVLNGRDVTYSVLAREYAKANAENTSASAQAAYLDNFKQMIGAYNQQLSHDLKGMPQVFIFNTFAFDDDLINKIINKQADYTVNGKQYALTNMSSSCYQNNQGDYQHVAGPVCTNPENYFYYDRIHTTNNVNYLLAQAVYQKFK